MAKLYIVNEVFYSLQGEGVRQGTPNVFIRFTGCNLRCSMEPGDRSPGGFDCDTEFTSGRKVSLDELHNWVSEQIGITLGAAPEWNIASLMKQWANPWIILTGGEPALQVDKEFIDYWHGLGFSLAIETNGTINLPKQEFQMQGGIELREMIDWITVSPKIAEHNIKQLYANELKYVRGYGQSIPKTKVKANHYLISPAFDAMSVHPKTLEWCTKLCLENPPWRLSIQQHKLLKVR